MPAIFFHIQTANSLEIASGYTGFQDVLEEQSNEPSHLVNFTVEWYC